jgi:ubiquitin-like protein ATG12
MEQMHPGWWIGSRSRFMRTKSLLSVTIRLQPIGSAPHLNQRVFKLSTNQRFETIVRFLRKKLGVKEHESVFCYVGSVFSPALDEGVGNLWTVGKIHC